MGIIFTIIRQFSSADWTNSRKAKQTCQLLTALMRAIRIPQFFIFVIGSRIDNILYVHFVNCVVCTWLIARWQPLNHGSSMEKMFLCFLFDLYRWTPCVCKFYYECVMRCGIFVPLFPQMQSMHMCISEIYEIWWINGFSWVSRE